MNLGSRVSDLSRKSYGMVTGEGGFCDRNLKNLSLVGQLAVYYRLCQCRAFRKS